jgi:hypothetical protein
MTGPNGSAAINQLLRATTAVVTLAGRHLGSAFFIDDDLALTCAHVVHDATHVDLTLVGGEPRGADVIDLAEDEDLALLRVVRSADALQPCVALHHSSEASTFAIAGFPVEANKQPGFECYEIGGHSRIGLDAAAQLLQLETGQLVTYGMSGGPVVDLDWDVVVGVVQSSRDPDRGEGGGAIPLSVAIARFPDVRDRVRVSPLAVRAWREHVGQQRWTRLGKRWDMTARLDLYVTGSETAWFISDSADGIVAGRPVTGGDLGDRVVEALFRWAAQRRRIHAKEEVEILAHLLSRGLIPVNAADRFRLAEGADVREVGVHLEAGSLLNDMPWELSAAPSSDPTKYLATDATYRFVRVADEPPGGNRRRPSAEATGPIDVLGAIAQPRRWRFAKVYGRQGGTPYQWPTIGDLEQNFRANVDVAPLKLELRVCPQPSDISELLENGPFSVFHYIGFGKVIDNEPFLAFVDADGKGESWTEALPLLELAREHGVRLVVLEFMLPPEGQDFDQITLSRLGSPIGGDLEAVVVTQQPVHATQCQYFNTKFYSELKVPGTSVTTAVQRARRHLANNRPVEDYAAFGWFALIAREGTDLTLIPAVSQDSAAEVHAERTVLPKPPSPARSEPADEPAADAFYR